MVPCCHHPAGHSLDQSGSGLCGDPDPVLGCVLPRACVCSLPCLRCLVAHRSSASASTPRWSGSWLSLTHRIPTLGRVPWADLQHPGEEGDSRIHCGSSSSVVPAPVPPRSRHRGTQDGAARGWEEQQNARQRRAAQGSAGRAWTAGRHRGTLGRSARAWDRTEIVGLKVICRRRLCSNHRGCSISKETRNAQAD